MIELREYQQRAIDLLGQSIRMGHKSPVLVQSTGSGKTRVAAAICERATLKGKRVLFITPRRALVYQAESAFQALGVDCGLHIAGEEFDNRHLVNVASMDTMISRIGRHSQELFSVRSADILVIDEAHLSVSEKRKEFLLGVLGGDYGERKIIIGLSASPCVAGGGGLGAVYDDLIVPITMHELIAKGYLCKPRYFSASRPDLSGVKITAGDYRQDALGAAYDDSVIMGDVVSTWIKNAPGTLSVVFTPTRATAQHLVERFCAAGYRAEYVDANTPDDERLSMFRRLGSGQTQLIINVGIISLGVDIPEIQTVVMATATKSVSRWVQAVGRCMRPMPGKDFCTILDHGGMCISKYMGRVEDIIDWTLEPKSLVQDRIAKRKEERKEPKEITCAACQAVFKARHACPSCGHVMKQPSEPLEFHDVELREIIDSSSSAAQKRNRKMTHDQKMQFMGELRGYARKHAYAEGWASNQYRDYLSVWPNAYKHAPMKEPSAETLRWIKSRQIAFAKRRRA